MYPSIEEAKKVLLAFGVRDDLIEGLNLLWDLNSREPIDFLSIDVPEDVLAKYGIWVVGRFLLIDRAGEIQRRCTAIEIIITHSAIAALATIEIQK